MRTNRSYAELMLSSILVALFGFSSVISHRDHVTRGISGQTSRWPRALASDGNCTRCTDSGVKAGALDSPNRASEVLWLKKTIWILDVRGTPGEDMHECSDSVDKSSH